MTLKILNSVLIVHICALRAERCRLKRPARALLESLRGTGRQVLAITSDLTLRLVVVGTPSQADQHIETRSKTCLVGLTPRQTQVLRLGLGRHLSKITAPDLNITQRTVENRRAAILRRTEATSLPALALLAVRTPNSAERKCA
jgi:DNA-binding NarL/FixJ family response regulator